MSGSDNGMEEREFRLGTVGARNGRNGLLARLRDALATVAPVGYEDETGFHMEMRSALAHHSEDRSHVFTFDI